MAVPTSQAERVFVAVGSNLGDRLLNVQEAARRVALIEGVELLAIGPLLDSAALVDPSDPLPQPRYLNTVLELATGLTPRELLDALLAVEHGMGRVRHARWAPRVIDLDLVLHGARVSSEPGLALPHPGLASRRFVLAPLVALAPDLRHPVSSTRLEVLLRRAPPC